MARGLPTPVEPPYDGALAGPTRTASERIADRLLAALAVGVLQPGERLPSERELAEQLDVSRTTVRQALSRLSALGVTESRRGRNGGTFTVKWQPTADATRAVLRTLEPIRRELETLFDFRSLLEQLIATTAARRHTPEDDAAMRQALANYRAARTASESREADRALHGAVASAARNRHLSRLAQDMVSRVNLGFTTEPYSEALHETAMHQHTVLVEAITSGDAELAAALAGEHFQMTTGDAWRAAIDVASVDGED
ncbi:MAG TPA: FCD domain-containing protein [Nocardioidaceae bacterium]|jgi:DNA-binding FadR family transcriptional regulator|nr:FCD domain-containing protein [Nocardioidaceae bacterium]